MQREFLSFVVFVGALCQFTSAADAADAPDALSALPAAWQADWRSPPACDRPLQIIHGIRPGPQTDANKAASDEAARAARAARAVVRQITSWKELGLGGVVCNVAFDDYLRSERNWRALTQGIEACKKAGMVAWVYDEEGYPSGAAGGLVLAGHPELEAMELTYDPKRPEPFQLRPSYEYTHASNNYHASRRYVNLLDDRATRRFLELTHDAYRKRLPAPLGSSIVAMFTDEPSLMAVHLGQLPESVRKNVRVVDRVDEAARQLPRVPWCYDLAERYQQRYGEDLMPRRKSLFTGDAAEDRAVRRRFWALVADLVAERYFGQIQQWCRNNRVAASGHCLWEEEVLHHVPLVGNCLKALSRMDIPGLDMLTSNPEAVIYSGWLTAGLPESAALLTGGRRVMTEVSDFAEQMGSQGPAPLATMQAAAAWQAAWGVTEFTLYYQPANRPKGDYPAYCAYVGRLNAILRDAQPVPEVLLYYPIHDLWAEYRPTEKILNAGTQSGKAQRIVASFSRLGQMLQQRQIPFTIVDHEFLASAKLEDQARLAIAKSRYRALVLPEEVELPAAAAGVVERFRAAGGLTLRDGAWPHRLDGEALQKAVRPAVQIDPPSHMLCVGRFEREGRPIVLAVNVGKAAYRGKLTGMAGKGWTLLDPAAASARPQSPDAGGALPLTLEGRQAVILVGR